jgi:hypothetical protein
MARIVTIDGPLAEMLCLLGQGCGCHGRFSVAQPFVRLIQPLANRVEVTKHG